MNVQFDFTGVDALGNNDGGYAPPEGAYKAVISEVTIEDSRNIAGSPNMVVSYNVTEGEHTGSGCRAWFPMPNGTDAKKDAFKLRKLKTLFLSLGVPASSLAGQFGLDLSQIQGKPLVMFVADNGTSAEGKRRYNADPVLPENAAAALTGEWTPHGGRKPATVAAPTQTMTAPSNGMQTAAPAAGGFSFSGFNAVTP